MFNTDYQGNGKPVSISDPTIKEFQDQVESYRQEITVDGEKIMSLITVKMIRHIDWSDWIFVRWVGVDAGRTLYWKLKKLMIERQKIFKQLVFRLSCMKVLQTAEVCRSSPNPPTLNNNLKRSKI